MYGIIYRERLTGHKCTVVMHNHHICHNRTDNVLAVPWFCVNVHGEFDVRDKHEEKDDKCGDRERGVPFQNNSQAANFLSHVPSDVPSGANLPKDLIEMAVNGEEDLYAPRSDSALRDILEFCDEAITDSELKLKEYASEKKDGFVERTAYYYASAMLQKHGDCLFTVSIFDMRRFRNTRLISHCGYRLMKLAAINNPLFAKLLVENVKPDVVIEDFKTLVARLAQEVNMTVDEVTSKYMLLDVISDAKALIYATAAQFTDAVRSLPSDLNPELLVPKYREIWDTYIKLEHVARNPDLYIQTWHYGYDIAYLVNPEAPTLDEATIQYNLLTAQEANSKFRADRLASLMMPSFKELTSFNAFLAQDLIENMASKQAFKQDVSDEEKKRIEEIHGVAADRCAEIKAAQQKLKEMELKNQTASVLLLQQKNSVNSLKNPRSVMITRSAKQTLCTGVRQSFAFPESGHEPSLQQIQESKPNPLWYDRNGLPVPYIVSIADEKDEMFREQLPIKALSTASAYTHSMKIFDFRVHQHPQLMTSPSNRIFEASLVRNECEVLAEVCIFQNSLGMLSLPAFNVAPDTISLELCVVAAPLPVANTNGHLFKELDNNAREYEQICYDPNGSSKERLPCGLRCRQFISANKDKFAELANEDAPPFILGLQLENSPHAVVAFIYNKNLHLFDLGPTMGHTASKVALVNNTTNPRVCPTCKRSFNADKRNNSKKRKRNRNGDNGIPDPKHKATEIVNLISSDSN